MQSKQLSEQIKQLGKGLGFSDVKITTPDNQRGEMLFKRWAALNNEGSMHYMQRHGLKRANIQQVFPETISIITVTLNYLPEKNEAALTALNNTAKPYISRYALNRDYHKLMRKKLQQLSAAIEDLLGKSVVSRAFVDSAPLMDKAFAQKSGLGWVGKHTNILNANRGSYFFLGELAINQKLVTDHPTSAHCGSCHKCIDVCPTQAITAPYQLDAEKCISYLTIEHAGEIPQNLRKAIGNRIYGCDDCQLYCPWNKYAQLTQETDFLARQALDSQTYAELFGWDEATFLKNTEGNPIRRIGYNRWQRNLAIAIGNYLAEHKNPDLLDLLKANRNPDTIVQSHITWAIEQATN